MSRSSSNRSGSTEVEAILGQGISGAPVMQIRFPEGRFALKFENGDGNRIEAEIHEKCRTAQLAADGPIFYSPRSIKVSDRLRKESIEMFLKYEAAKLGETPQKLQKLFDQGDFTKESILQSIHYHALKNAKIAFLFPIVEESSCEQTLARIAASHQPKAERASILDKKTLLSTIDRVAKALDWLKMEGYIHDDLLFANIFGVGDKTQLADFSNAKAIKGNNEMRQREQFVRLIRAFSVSQGYFNTLVAMFLIKGIQDPVSNMHKPDINLPDHINFLSSPVRPRFPMLTPNGQSVDTWLMALEDRFQTHFVKEIGDKWVASGASYQELVSELAPIFEGVLVD